MTATLPQTPGSAALSVVASQDSAYEDGAGGALADPPYPAFRRAAYGLLLLILAMWIARFDRVIFSLTQEAIKTTLDLSDTQLGSLQGLAWKAAYGIAAFPLGILIDRKNRTRLLMIAVITWSAFAFLTGFCETYWQMFICRAGAGMAEAALFPASFSLICDLFPPGKRRLANIVYLGGSFLGASIGFAAGSLAIEWVAHSAPTLPHGLADMPIWRLAFFATIIPSALLALLFISASEPARQMQPGESIVPEMQIDLARYLRENRVTVICLFFALVMVGHGADEIIGWMPSILSRSYGWDGPRAGEWLSVVFLVGSLGGIALGGLVTWLFDTRWGEQAPLQTMRIGAGGAALSLVPLIFVGSAEQLLLVATIHTTFAFMAFSVGPGLLMTIAPNHLRGRLYGIKSLVGTIAGSASPLAIGILSDRMFHSHDDGLLLALCALLIPISALVFVALAVVGGALRKTLRSVEGLVPEAAPNGKRM